MTILYLQVGGLIAAGGVALIVVTGGGAIPIIIGAGLIGGGLFFGTAGAITHDIKEAARWGVAGFAIGASVGGMIAAPAAGAGMGFLRFAGIQAGRAALETGMEWGLAEVTGDESFTANYALWALSRNFTLNMLTGGAARYFDALEGAGKMTARLNRMRKYLPAGEYVAETALETAGEVIYNDRDIADVFPQIAISNALTAGISLAGAGRRASRGRNYDYGDFSATGRRYGSKEPRYADFDNPNFQKHLKEEYGIRVYAENLNGRPAAVKAITGDIRYNPSIYNRLPDDVKNRVFWEELYHMRTVVSMPKPIRRIKAIAYKRSGLVQLLEEFSAVRYAELSRLRSLEYGYKHLPTRLKAQLPLEVGGYSFGLYMAYRRATNEDR